VRSLGIPPRPRTAAWWGGCSSPEKFAGAPYQASESHVLRQRCDACGFTLLPIEIIARRKVAPAFEPQRDRRAGSPNAKRGHDTGPERGPSLQMQGSVWRSCGSSLTRGTQAPDDRMEGSTQSSHSRSVPPKEGMRKDRPFADGSANGSYRPVAVLPDQLRYGRRTPESGRIAPRAGCASGSSPETQADHSFDDGAMFGRSVYVSGERRPTGFWIVALTGRVGSPGERQRAPETSPCALNGR
jgi:hypothetical protein